MRENGTKRFRKESRDGRDGRRCIKHASEEGIGDALLWDDINISKNGNGRNHIHTRKAETNHACLDEHLGGVELRFVETEL